MLVIDGSSSTTTTTTTEGELLMKFWNAKQDQDCVEVDLRDIDFDPNLAGAFMDIASAKVWKTIRITHCRGGPYVNDVLMACCAKDQRISTLEVRLSSTATFTATAATTLDHSNTIFAFAFGLNYAKNLRHLTLGIPRLDEEAANTLSRAIARNTWLETLNLSNIDMAPQSIGPLSFGLRLNRTIQKLVLDGCALQDEQVATLLTALQEHPCLKVLSLQQNACHTQGMGVIASLLHYNTALEELDLSYLIRKKKQEPPPAAVAPVPEVPDLSESTKEEVLEEAMTEDANAETNDNGEDQQGSDAAAETARKEGDTSDVRGAADDDDNDNDSSQVRNTTLKNFQMAGNGINDDFLQSMLGIFGSDSALEELNLFGNRITDRGLGRLIQKLPRLKHLQRVALGHNLIGPSAALLLVEAMKTNYSIEDVQLQTFDPILESAQNQLSYYATLNRGGRRILATTNSVPLSLWPSILERAMGILPTPPEDEGTQATTTLVVVADLIFCLLHGPVLFENINLLY